MNPGRAQIAVVLLALLALGTAHEKVRRLPTGTFFVHIFGPWQYPPPELGNPTRTAPATILRFESNGQYVEHSCYIIDTRHGELYISAGDGHTVAVGTWSQD